MKKQKTTIVIAATLDEHSDFLKAIQNACKAIRAEAIYVPWENVPNINLDDISEQIKEASFFGHIDRSTKQSRLGVSDRSDQLNLTGPTQYSMLSCAMRPFFLRILQKSCTNRLHARTSLANWNQRPRESGRLVVKTVVGITKEIRLCTVRARH